MDRLACVNIPDVALQSVHVRHPEWRGEPVVVVADASPQARIRSANGHARTAGVIPGMRYAAGLSLLPHLRADVVSAGEIDGVIGTVAGVLQRFSPAVEASPDEPGVFWVDVSGLDGLYRSRTSWAEAVRAALTPMNLRAAVAVGFSKFGTYAATALSAGIRVFNTPEEERHTTLQAPLRHLHVPDDAYAVLAKLGVRDVAALLALPPDGVLSRLGREVHRLYRFAAGDLWVPLQPRPERASPHVALALDAPDESLERLLFLIKRSLPALFATLAERGEALAGLDVRLKPEGQFSWCEAHVRPASPTMDEVQLVDLVRLRLESTPLPGRVAELTLQAHGVPWAPDAGRLLPEHPGRDLAAGRRALARVRAVLGDGAVVRARLRDGHLPEARFVWEPVDQVVLPRPVERAHHTLVRRVWTRPLPLAHGAPVQPEDNVPAAERLLGPYIVSGGWWLRAVHREYYFIERRRGEWLWMYFDRARQRWFLHGRVE